MTTTVSVTRSELTEIFQLGKMISQGLFLHSVENKGDTFVFNFHNSVPKDYNSLSKKQREVIEKKLTEFDLSVRAINAAKRAEVLTLKDLAKFDGEELRKWMGIGKGTIKEFEKLLADNGLQFGMKL